MQPVLWSLYVIRTRDGQLYTGIATDVVRRFHEHSAGGRGSKFLRGRGPLVLVYECELGDRSLALRTEAALKRRTKRGKEAILARDPTAAELMGELGVVDSA